ncbi:MAG TPA: tRNA uridine-5-carboxymethylaminomethyl(34) synthesis GTPase MnmE [Firmicutes bacterium]|nr:tRNA uridine-5-carboxymethylaminomethyl(34) synthesis GTPase MnmE [Bacillota bacterium]
MDDLISAIATAVGAGGIAVVRMSGRGALSVARKMFSRKGEFQPNYMYAGEIDAGTFRDYGMCVYFRAPKSFTGEDVVEFHCHGGTEIARGILKRTLELGARLAERGEFTKRAYLNGKLSLSAAEGVGEMIAASSEAQVRAGYLLYNEKLTSLGTALQRKLTHCLAEVDADLDYPEEDLNASSRAEIAATLREVGQELAALLSQYAAGRKIRSGVSVALVGAPNAGKSSLLNALLGYERAIVSDVAGTTRDVVEGTLEIEGVNFRITDTAGLRESADAIEREGVRRAREAMKGADVIVWLKEDGEVPEFPEGTPVITVGAKSDLARREDCDIVLSSYTGEGLDALRRLLYERGFGRENDGAFLLSERHYRAAQAAHEAVKEALASAEGGLPPELYAEDIRRAWETLGTLSGETASEAIVTEIFEKFCVGK